MDDALYRAALIVFHQELGLPLIEAGRFASAIVVWSAETPKARAAVLEVHGPALRASDTGRSEAEAELRRHWHDFCDADPTPDGFVERMDAAGLAELRAVTRGDLEDPFASERGIYKGGSLWALTATGRTALSQPAKGEDA